MDKKQLYLEYIDKLYNRRKTSSNSSGITLWALLIAFVYICWEIVSSIEKAQIKVIANEFNLIVIPIYSLIFFNIVYINLLITKTSSKKNRESDYRIRGIYLDDYKVLLYFLCLIIPAFLGLVNINAGFNIPFIAISSNCIVLLFLTLALLVVYLENHNSFGINTFEINANSSKKKKLVGGIIVFALLVLNLLGFISFIKHNYLLSENFAEIFKLGLNFSLLNIISILVIRYSSGFDETLLVNLERDIILKDLNNEDIKKRLEEDILGSQLSEIIVKKLTEVRAGKEGYINIIKQAENVISEINNIEENYQHEKNARMNEYIKKMDSQYAEFKVKVDTLTEWCRNPILKNFAKDDPYIKEILYSINKELSINLKDIDSATLQVKESLKNIVLETSSKPF